MSSTRPSLKAMFHRWILRRSVTNRINWALDNLLPPILRDSALVMALPFRLLFGDKRHRFAEFKEQAPFLGRAEYVAYYEELADKHLHRETDLDKRCLERH